MALFSHHYTITDTLGTFTTITTYTTSDGRKTKLDPMIANPIFGLNVTRKQAAHALRTAHKQTARVSIMREFSYYNLSAHKRTIYTPAEIGDTRSLSMETPAMESPAS